MQQLLIMLLAVIVVGLGIMTGLQRAEEGHQQAQKDALMQELMVVVGRAQAWYRAPGQLGGGNGSFRKLTFNAVNFDSTRFIGNYVLAEIQDQSFRVIGVGKNSQTLLMITLEAFPDSVTVVEIVQ
ncbi:hypothetical protein L0152_27400 [bacterium]|nr:hypothetical protein [bacterium]